MWPKWNPDDPTTVRSRYESQIRKRYLDLVNFNALSLPFPGDQAVNAHATRAPAPPLLRGEGLVYRTIRVSKGDDRALPGLWG